MLSVESKLGLPTGEGGKLNRLATERWKERLVRLVPVKNKVIWVNPNFPNLPFGLKLNEQTPLGLFVKSVLPENPATGKLKEGSQIGEHLPSHHRSILLTRAMLADNNGQVYRDIDLKGIGYVSTKGYEEYLHGAEVEVNTLASVQSRGESGYYGLFEEISAMYDRDKSEEFNALGIRTPRALAIIRLLEVIYKDGMVSISSLKEKGILPQDSSPVIEVRVFRNKARISDYACTRPGNYSLFARDYGSDDFLPRVLLADAKEIIRQELGLNSEISDSDYFKYLVKLVATNIGLMHKSGWMHNYLTVHNITLNGDIADFDSVSQLENFFGQERDIVSALGTLVEFNAFLGNLKLDIEFLDETYPQIHDKLAKEFWESYLQAFPVEQQRRGYLDLDRLRARI